MPDDGRVSELPAIKLPAAAIGDTVVVTSEATGQAWEVVTTNAAGTTHTLRATTAVPAPVPTPTPTPTPVAKALWIPHDRLMALPASGPAFDSLKAKAATAEVNWGPSITDQDSERGRTTMATALVAARLNDNALRGKVRDSIKRTIGQDDKSRANALLEWGRNIPGFVIAADLIGLKTFDSAVDTSLR